MEKFTIKASMEDENKQRGRRGNLAGLQSALWENGSLLNNLSGDILPFRLRTSILL